MLARVKRARGRARCPRRLMRASMRAFARPIRVPEALVESFSAGRRTPANARRFAKCFPSVLRARRATLARRRGSASRGVFPRRRWVRGARTRVDTRAPRRARLSLRRADAFARTPTCRRADSNDGASSSSKRATPRDERSAPRDAFAAWLALVRHRREVRSSRLGVRREEAVRARERVVDGPGDRFRSRSVHTPAHGARLARLARARRHRARRHASAPERARAVPLAGALCVARGRARGAARRGARGPARGRALPERHVARLARLGAGTRLRRARARRAHAARPGTARPFSFALRAARKRPRGRLSRDVPRSRSRRSRSLGRARRRPGSRGGGRRARRGDRRAAARARPRRARRVANSLGATRLRRRVRGGPKRRTRTRGRVGPSRGRASHVVHAFPRSRTPRLFSRGLSGARRRTRARACPLARSRTSGDRGGGGGCGGDGDG